MDIEIKIPVNNKLKFEFKIFTKLAHTDSVIPKDSFHHPIAAFQNYCSGVHNIFKNKNNLNKEIEMIKAIAKDNGYKTELIDKIIKNLENKNVKLKD